MTFSSWTSTSLSPWFLSWGVEWPWPILLCLAHLWSAGQCLTSLPIEDVEMVLSMPSSTGASSGWEQGPVFTESVRGFKSMIYYADASFASCLPLQIFSLTEILLLENLLWACRQFQQFPLVEYFHLHGA